LDKLPLALGDLLEDIVALDSHLAEAKQIHLVADLAPNLPILTIDPERIRQVTNNLISNAIKFSHPGTEVIVRALVRDKVVEVSVIDQGQGINEAEIGKLFKDFQRTTTRPTGEESSSGLGLSISKRLVTLHGGQIGVESTHGAGSRFYFTLPISNSDSSDP
jgi:two-component system sensor histidine kinase ChiS